MNFNKRYIFVLGRKNRLSKAEVLAVFSGKIEVIMDAGSFLVVDLAVKVNDWQATLDQMGGVLKVIEVIDSGTVTSGIEAIQEIVVNLLANLAVLREGKKFVYGVSVLRSNSNLKVKTEEILRKILVFAKKTLRAKNVKGRFVNKPWKNVNNVFLVKEKVLDKGGEVMIGLVERLFFVGRTVAVQQFEAYSLRDFDKPRRNPKRGMLPPKLSQMMLNLSGAASYWSAVGQKLTTKNTCRGVIYDPFCGNGTLLMEAMLMGFDVIGSDISAEAVADTIVNLGWIQNAFPQCKERHFYVFEKDVCLLEERDVVKALEKIGSLDGQQKTVSDVVKAVATETYLGPPMTKLPDASVRHEVERELSGLCFEAFKNFQKIFGSAVPVVVTLPVYRDRKNYFPMKKSVEKIESLGYRAKDLLKGQKSLIYDRPDQVVGREVFRFQK